MTTVAKKAKRADTHRPGAIVPADYEPVLSYSLATSVGGFPIPAIGIDCEMDRRREHRDANGVLLEIENGKHFSDDGSCCVLGLRYVAKVKWARTGGIGKCSVCGANYVYGDVWKHVPSGEHVHVGHDCSDKYQLLMDRSAWELENGRVRAAAAREMIREENREEREAYLKAHPKVASAFALVYETYGPHLDATGRKLAVLADMERRFTQYRSLSEKQVAYAVKLAAEVRDPAPPKPEEQHVPAPEGRLTIRGVLVSRKLYESDFGDVFKGTVKVVTPEGTWLAWGTIPASLAEAEKGDEVELTATLKRGRDAHFALWKRPTKGTVTKRAAPKEGAK